MDKSIQKFENFIRQDLILENKNLIFEMFSKDNGYNEEEYVDILTTRAIKEFFIDLICMDKEMWKENNLIFDSFSELSNCLINSTLTNRDCIKVIEYFINLNIENGCLEENENLKYSDKNESLEKMSSSLAYHIFSKIFRHAFGKRGSFVDLDEIISKKIKQNYKNSNSYFSCSNLIECHRIIKECYLDKKDNQSEEDIEKTIKAFKNLGVADQICNNFRVILKNQRKKKEKKNIEISIKSKKTEISKSLTQKEYRLILEELNNYYDFNDMYPIRPLSLSERMYCLELLLKVGYNNSQILQFLKSFEYYPDKYNNVISKYLENYDKIKYYEEKYGLQEFVKNLEDWFLELFICNDKDYIDMKGIMTSELDIVMKQLPKTYEYELKKVNKKI